jgi:TolB protein
MDLSETVRSRTPLFAPSWSPDGKKLAFTAFRAERVNLEEPDLDIDVFALGGRSRTRLVEGYAPCWSPDAKHIVFHRSEKGGSPALFKADLDSRAITEFISGSAATVAWSRDEKQLAFVAPGAEDRFDLFVMDQERRKRRQLTKTADVEFGTQWSKDGRRIYFARAKRDDLKENGEPRVCHVFSIDLADGAEQQLTKGESVNFLGGGGEMALMFHVRSIGRKP